MSNGHKTCGLAPLLALALAGASALSCRAAGSEDGYSVAGASVQSSPGESFYAQGLAAVKKENFKEAAFFFGEALDREPENADALNMFAYSQRKLGKLDEAFASYAKALKIRPKFPQAREYLGEAHLQAVLREIETLKSYKDAGAKDLEKLKTALKTAAAGL